MSPRGNILLWLIATAAVAALSSWIVSHRPAPDAGDPSRSSGENRGRADQAELSLHEWMHRQLDLSPAQHAALEPMEREYERERLRLREKIRQLGASLALAMRNSAPDADIFSLQRQLNSAQGELQEATLRHFIAMRRQLNPRQAENLALWTHDSLLSGSAD